MPRDDPAASPDYNAEEVVPRRCFSCAHYAGGENCNRYFPPFGRRAKVKKHCRVRQWPALPYTDDQGNASGESSPGPLVDAYVPLRKGKLEYQGQSLTPTQLFKKMGNPFAKVAESRDKVEMKYKTLHQDRMGTSGEIGRASDLPKWTCGEEKIPTGLPQLDWALNGGLVPGIKWKSWGRNHTWKTSLTSYFIGVVQDYYEQKTRENFEFLAERYDFEPTEETLEGMIASHACAALVDEGYDRSWGAKQGADSSKLKVFEMEYMSQSLDILAGNLQEDLSRIQTNFDPELESWMRAVNFHAVLIDSWDSMKQWADEHGAKDKENTLNDNAKIGARASTLSQFWRQYARSNKVPTSMFSVAQQRTNIGAGMAFGHGNKGNADRHNTRLEARHKTKTPNNGEQEITLEFYQTQQPGGTNVGERGDITIIGHLQRGLDPDINLVHAATEQDIVKKSSWLTYIPEDGSKDDKISQQGTSFYDYAQLLKDEGVYDEVYQKTVEAYDQS